MTRSASVTCPTSAPRGDNLPSAWFRAIAEMRGDVAWVVDCASRQPSYVSPLVSELLGYPIEDFAQQLSGGAAPAALAPLCNGLDERLQRFVAGDRSRLRVVRQFELRHRDGRLIPVEVTSTLMLDEQGQPLALAGVLRDTSDERERAAQQRRFASMLNHEFRTPLSTIDGAIQRLEVTGANADEATRGRYRKIQNAVDRLIGMLDDYLSPERMDDIGSTRQADSLAPRQLLEEAASLVVGAGMTVAVDCGNLPATMRCQPQGLRLALNVLVENAIRYSPPACTIELAGRSLNDGIELSVRDQGGGVPAGEEDRIFDKRYRGSNALGAGSGLGLYMARSVIDVHGGAITVQQVEPTGALFKIWLPATRAAGKRVAPDGINSDNSAHQQTGDGAAQN